VFLILGILDEQKDYLQKEGEGMKSRSILSILMFFFLAVLMVTGSAFPSSASAATVTWKMATKMPPTSPEGLVFQKFADLVKAKSKGAMVIEVFPAEQLGKTEAILEQLQAGVIQIYPEGESYLQKYKDDIKFTNAPFLFRDREQYARFMDSDMVKGWLDGVAKEDNIMVLGKIADFVRGPYRVMVSKKPIKTLADIQGLKLRLHPDNMAIAAWKYLGANVIVLPWSEIYEALGRGIIEACNSPMALVESMKFYEQAKYVIRHNEFPQGMAFMTNYKQFNALSPELQKILLDAHKEACAFSAKIMYKRAKESIARMKKQGVHYSEINTKPFVDKMMELYKKWETEGKMPKGFLEVVNES
jgi:tripartite ATP-independent transporter DctP family solute receptor